MKGFYVIEGGEGAGKGTVTAAVAESLRARGAIVTVTREPGGCPIAERLRDIFKDPASKTMNTMASLGVILAARAQHVKEVILPALERGEVVLCDRFVGSTMAYQYYGNPHKDVPLSEIKRLHETFSMNLYPDVTILLDVPVEVGLARAAAARGCLDTDRFDGEKVDFHERLRDGFGQLARTEKGWCVVDANRPVDVVVDETVKALLEHKSGTGENGGEGAAPPPSDKSVDGERK